MSLASALSSIASSRLFSTAAGVVAGAAIVGGSTLALAQVNGGDTINACVRNSGSVRIVHEGDSCEKNETPLAWNQQGPQGEAGQPGADGQPGAPGISGLVTEEIQFQVFAGEISQDSVFCPEGKSALGATWTTQDPANDKLVSLALLGDRVFVNIPAQTTDRAVTVRVTCATVAP